jgi:undecaprenyl-diphosphatase
LTYALALLFGAVQGLTEFLPVSSSGHLAILSMLALDGESDLVFTILLHVATFAAVCVAYRRDIYGLLRAFFLFVPDKIKKRETSAYTRMIGMMIISLLPLVAVIPFKSRVEEAFASPLSIGVSLLVTAVLLFLSDRFNKGAKTFETMTVKDALIIGLFQLCAVLPGLSRSGTTLAAALFCGLDRENAVKYSFILSLPTIAAAAVLELSGAVKEGIDAALIGPYALGCAVAAVTGFAAIFTVRIISKKGKLRIFSYYTAALGAGLLLSLVF